MTHIRNSSLPNKGQCIRENRSAYHSICISGIHIEHSKPAADCEWNCRGIWRILELWSKQVMYHIDCNLSILDRRSGTTIASNHCEGVRPYIGWFIVERQTYSNLAIVAVQVKVCGHLSIQVEVLDLVCDCVPWSLKC